VPTLDRFSVHNLANRPHYKILNKIAAVSIVGGVALLGKIFLEAGNR
jgi:hypothetical protein